MNVGYQRKSISWKCFMFHEMTLKLYFIKCSERKISQCILTLIDVLTFDMSDQGRIIEEE